VESAEGPGGFLLEVVGRVGDGMRENQKIGHDELLTHLELGAGRWVERHCFLAGSVGGMGMRRRC
jgi:hypothetical protein